MAGAASDYSWVSKEVFPEGDPYWNQINQEKVLLELIEEDPNVPFNGTLSEGKYFVYPARSAGGANPAVPTRESQRNTGLVTPSFQTGTQIKYNRTRMDHAIELMDDAMHVVKGGEAATIDALQLEMREAMPDIQQESNRWYHGEGGGLLATPTGAPAGGNTFTVDSTTRMPVGRQFVVRDLDQGTLHAQTTLGTALQVSSVTNSTTFVATDEDGNAINLTDTTTGFGIYPYDTQGNAINGLGIICSASNPTTWGSTSVYFGNVDASTETWWQAYEHNAGGDAIDIQADLQAWKDAQMRRAGSWLKAESKGQNLGITIFGVTGHQNYRAIGNALQSSQFTTANYKTLTGGFTGVEYEGMVIVPDADAVASRIRFWCPRELRRYVLKPWGWDDTGGSIWERQRANDGRETFIWRARMFTYQNLLTVRRKCHGQIYNTVATS